MSAPHGKTDLDALVEHLVIRGAKPAPDKTRRGMILIGENQEEVKLVACEQRTAISWLEAIQLMLAKSDKKKNSKIPGGNIVKRVRSNKVLPCTRFKYLTLASTLKFQST